MSQIMISHSHSDEMFARRLKESLEEVGHTVWVYQDQIDVGDDNIRKMTEGVAGADFLIVVLSKISVQSKWVEVEWKAKFYDQINQRRTMVLPVVIEINDPEIPYFLRPFNYADFRGGYDEAFKRLLRSITRKAEAPDERPRLDVPVHIVDDAHDLIAKLQGRQATVSQCVAEGLKIARRASSLSLEAFCHDELAGYSDKRDVKAIPQWRTVELIVSKRGEIDIEKLNGFRDGREVLDSMRRDKERFFTQQIFLQLSLAEIESLPISKKRKTLIRITLKAFQIDPTFQDREATAFCYASSDSLAAVIDAVRKELTRRLLALT